MYKRQVHHRTVGRVSVHRQQPDQLYGGGRPLCHVGAGPVSYTHLVSLVTAKLVGMGIIGHQFSLSWSAIEDVYKRQVERAASHAVSVDFQPVVFGGLLYADCHLDGFIDCHCNASAEMRHASRMSASSRLVLSTTMLNPPLL